MSATYLSHADRPTQETVRAQRSEALHLRPVNVAKIVIGIGRLPLHSFSAEDEPLRLVEQSVAKDDPDPKAISCYGLYMPDLLGRTWLRF